MAVMKTVADLRIPFLWKDRHPVLLDRCLYIPSFFHLHNEWKVIPWSDPQIFGDNKPVIIEYCSGNGQWICDRAKAHPNVNWVAVEKRFDRARKIWARLHREELTNLFVVCGEALTFTRYYVPKASVSEVFINFPDPWPKLRHAKHRLVSKDFTNALECILVPQGKVMITTDDLPYVNYVLEVISQSQWKPLCPEPFFKTDVPDFGSSYFCDLWKKKGRSIYHLLFEALS